MTPRTRILFVDDEPPVLTAIARQLRRDRERWEMVFALGGERGLDEVHKGCFTVVVSDLRMPNVDGVQLLNAIGEACPKTVRIILSGDAEVTAMSQAVPELHCVLTKPCDSATLRHAIERAIDAAPQHC